MQVFRSEERWIGSFYELSLVYRERMLDIQARLYLLRLLWNSPSLSGVVDSWKEFGEPMEIYR